MAEERLAGDAGQEIFESIVHSVPERGGDVGGNSVEPDFDFKLASNPYGHFCIPESLSATVDAMAVMQGQVPEESTLRLIRRKLGRGDLVTGCLGIGAALPALHEALAPSAVIHAFDPDDTAGDAVAMTVGLNGLERVQVHKLIAGKRNRPIPATKLDTHASEAGAVGSGDAPADMIQMNQLDTIVPQGRYVSVFLLNAHGREMQAVLGAKRVVHDSAPMIVMKTPNEQTQRFYQSCLDAHFPDLRYRYAGSMDGNSIFVALDRD